MTTLEAILTEIEAELDRAVRKFPTWPDDIIHAGNIVTEEAGELAKAILQSVYEPRKSDLDDVGAEAVQTAAMAIRFLLSLHRYDRDPSEQHAQEAAP